MERVKVGASILAADFANLGENIKEVEKAGIDFLHIDVMDGHFVDNITIGPCVVNSISKVTSLPQYAHLMIQQPYNYIEPFAKAGANMLTFHIETVEDEKVPGLVEKIRSLECKVGIALNPDTAIGKLLSFLDSVDLILIMSVYPGFSGQKFLMDVLEKIRYLRKKFDGLIQVDGGVNDKTGRLAVESGANVLVAASYIFKSGNINESVTKLKNIC